MKLDKELLTFLVKLDKNNNRPWFQANKDKHDAVFQHFKDFSEAIANGMRKTDLIEDVKVFRIYRDVRFSKDKTPYKNNLGVGFKRATSKLRGGYYLQIEPGASFVGGGFWAPNNSDLKRIRDEFSFDPHTINKIQSNKTFVKYFCAIDGDALKTVPRGYDINLPAIDLIRKKQFVIRRRFSDEEILSPKFYNEVIKSFEAMRPFFDYMSDVLTTDLNGEPL